MMYGSLASPLANPLPIARPRELPTTGAITAASPGPPSPIPTSGLTTEVP